MNTKDKMDRLARVREAGRAAGILMRMETKRLGDKFTVPLTATNVTPEAEPDRNYGLHADRGDTTDLINATLYIAMAPHLLAAIEAARAALLVLVADGVR